jgi:hypothetical protein
MIRQRLLARWRRSWRSSACCTCEITEAARTIAASACAIRGSSAHTHSAISRLVTTGARTPRVPFVAQLRSRSFLPIRRVLTQRTAKICRTPILRLGGCYTATGRRVLAGCSSASPPASASIFFRSRWNAMPVAVRCAKTLRHPGGRSFDAPDRTRTGDPEHE